MAIFWISVALPLVERRAIDACGRNSRVVEVIHDLWIDEQFSPSCLRGLGLKGINELPVLAEEGRFGVVIAFDQRMLNEKLPRRSWINGRIAHAPLWHNRQAHQR